MSDNFSCAGVVLLRAPAQSIRHAAVTFTDIVEGGADEAQKSVDYLRLLAEDGLLREAVEVSSPSLAYRWEEILCGREERISDIRRVVRAVSAYQLRMTTRCTPFGLMAGVAVAHFAAAAESARAHLGTAHGKLVRVERDWVTALTIPWTVRPEILETLRISANNLCRVRGARLVLEYLPLADPDAVQEQVREISVRYTHAVQAALKMVRGEPLRYAELKRRLALEFPAAPEGTIDRMLVELVSKEFLLTDLRPPAETSDAALHVLNVLSGVGSPDCPGLAGLRDVVSSLSDYAAIPLGQGLDAWRGAVSRMRELRTGHRGGVQVDLVLDADVALPPAVAAEAERAVDMLWRIVPATTRSSELDLYHAEFVERYGLGRAIPVMELLDPEAGLGAPVGYMQPPSTRPVPAVPPAVFTERDRLMIEFAQEALLSGTDEVVINETHPLVVQVTEPRGWRPASVELFAQLLATSIDELRKGEFRLVVKGGSAGPAASTFGRFSYLFPDNLRASLAELAHAVGAADVASPDALRAQLVFQSCYGRGDNVAQVPQLLEHIVPVGVFADMSEPGSLTLENLAICADAHRLRIVDITSGREVLPAVQHRLNTHYLAPNAVRLLDEIGRGEARGVRWDWGQARNLPYVPRVRYGNVILSLARWRPSEAVRDQKAPFDAWVESLQAWRKRWRVPDRVCSDYTDQRLELDLTQSLHLRLLRHELGRRPATLLQEQLDPEGTGSGWLAGPDGPYRNELVIPLMARSAPAAAEQPSPSFHSAPFRLSPQRQHNFEYSAGSEWLYAAVYSTAGRQNELLVHYVSSLLADLPEEVDRWFFVRYQDPDSHLRLRFHAAPEVLTAAVLPCLHDWARMLRAGQLIRGFRLSTYDPELERYGGPEAITAAERFFHADSSTALRALMLQESGRLSVEPWLMAAASQAHLARTFWTAYDGPNGNESAWLFRVLEAIPRGEMHRVFQRHRREALALVDADGSGEELRARPGGEELLAAWKARETALTDYARTLRALGNRSWTPPTPIFVSLLHLHHNRLMGPDSLTEQSTTAIMRGALQAHRDRQRNAP